jgi:hypothetical protein
LSNLRDDESALGFWKVCFLEIVKVGWNYVALFVQQALIGSLLRDAVDVMNKFM